MDWFRLDKARQKTILEQTSAKTGIPVFAVEKDIWVSILLKAVFSLPYANQLIFKGGTSLSKGWDLIKWFSEDIDISISREHLGFTGDLSNEKIDQLRKEVYKFCHGKFLEDVSTAMEKLKVPSNLYSIEPIIKEVRKGPAGNMINYQSVLDKSNEYVQPRVLLELSGRSQKEPKENMVMNTIVSEQYPNISQADINSEVPTIIPQRTFLEKLFLLHEEFTKPIEKINANRRSRHLYDVVEIHKKYGKGLWDETLFNDIRQYRQKYTPILTTDYDDLTMANISFIPDGDALEIFEADYKVVKENMIYGDGTLEWVELIKYLQKTKDEMVSYKKITN